MKNIDPIQSFLAENEKSIKDLCESSELKKITANWFNEVIKHRYTYLFTSLGRPIIQFPQDMVAIHELIWETRPDLIIETGIAHGGSLIHSASMLAILDMCDAIEAKATIDPSQSKRKVLGIDVDIRPHNRQAIESHPLASRIQMIEGSSISQEVIERVRSITHNYERVMVCLDSNHTHEHVLAELQAYAPLVSSGCYCVVFDTVVDDMPDDYFVNRPWGQGNNPKTAVHEYIKTAPDFSIDKNIESKLVITVAPDGYLKKSN
jgi:cephalosporin hydroxylase